MPRFVMQSETVTEPDGAPASGGGEAAAGQALFERRTLLILKPERQCQAVDRRAKTWTKFGAARGAVGPERGITLTSGDAKEEEIVIEDPELDSSAKESALVEQLRKGVKAQPFRRKETS